MVNTDFDRKALAEVYEVIIMLKNEDFNKIPKEIVEAIKLNKDNEYEVDFQKLVRDEMLPDTRQILSAIYTYYLADKQEKKVIFELINIRKQTHVKYPIFEKNNKIEENSNIQDMVAIKKQNLFARIFEKIKRILRR